MEYEYGVEIGVWEILQDSTTLDITFYKYGREVGRAFETRILTHEELYDRLSSCAMLYEEVE